MNFNFLFAKPEKYFNLGLLSYSEKPSSIRGFKKRLMCHDTKGPSINDVGPFFRFYFLLKLFLDKYISTQKRTHHLVLGSLHTTYYSCSAVAIAALEKFTTFEGL